MYMPLHRRRPNHGSSSWPDEFSRMSPESGPRIGCHKMRYITLATVAALAVGVAVTTHAGNARMLNGVARPFLSEARPGASSVASLNALLAEWDHAGFNAPGKPGQARVYGREGYVTTDGGYNFMVSLIRSAEIGRASCRERV